MNRGSPEEQRGADASTQAQRERTVKDTIVRALSAVGLQQGDLVLMHSASSAIGRMLGGTNWGRALELMWIATSEVLGVDGTLIVPTFNWDFCKGHPYDAARTASQVGLFSNYIRNRPGALRSLHPIFPFAGIGPHCVTLFDGISKSSFGAGSVFDRLRRNDAKICFLNTSFYVCTFVHHVEQMLSVPYRYSKQFSGRIILNGVTYEDSFEFFVRDERLVVDSYPTRLGEQMRRQGLLHAATLGDSEVLATTCDDVFREATVALREDPFFLLKAPPVPVNA